MSSMGPAQRGPVNTSKTSWIKTCKIQIVKSKKSINFSCFSQKNRICLSIFGDLLLEKGMLPPSPPPPLPLNVDFRGGLGHVDAPDRA